MVDKFYFILMLLILCVSCMILGWQSHILELERRKNRRTER